jgi:uncharacterized tellurite resistance protein B-like protein
MIDKLRTLWSSGRPGRRMTEFQTDPATAVCALLLEASEVDQQSPPEEQALVRSLLKDRYGLDESALEQLLARTREERSTTGDLWPFTHYLRRTCSPEQKLELLVMVWQVIFADRRLDPYEEQWARRLPEMLAVNTSLMIEAKLRARALSEDPVPAPAG